MNEHGTLATVGWIGDGDEAHFCSAIERVFELRLPPVLHWTRFGDVLDHVCGVIDRRGGTGGSCATQMTFYRLRRAAGVPRASPDMPLAVPDASVRRWFSSLEAATDLTMPACRAGVRGMVGGLVMSAAAVAIVLAPVGPAARLWLLLAGGAAWLVKQSDGRRLPAGCRTLGELARLTADRNRGRLARSGARLPRAEVWTIIQHLGAEEGGHDPARIGLNTCFFRSSRHSAAAH